MYNRKEVKTKMMEAKIITLSRYTGKEIESVECKSYVDALLLVANGQPTSDWEIWIEGEKIASGMKVVTE